MDELRTTSSFSTRARLALRTSAIALLATTGAMSQAQVTPPNTPNANPTSQATQDSPPSPGVPTPNAQQVQQAQVDQATQDPVAPDPADIVVTGIRAGLASSAKTKRDATLIVDSVSAEDVGKLPDVSIADSLDTRSADTLAQLKQRLANAL